MKKLQPTNNMIENTSSNSRYLDLAREGSNSWKAYCFTILISLLGITVGGVLFGVLTPLLKSLFPEGALGKSLGTYIIVGGTFGFGIISFAIAFQKFHKRKFLSLLGVRNKFNVKHYLLGFLSYGVLIFAINLACDFNSFKTFLATAQPSTFLLLFVVGFVFIGLQAFFEELLIRGYLLQGMGLKIKNITWLILSNGFIFALLHLGYGIESFIQNLFLAIVFAIITLQLERLEFVAGAHSAKNLLLTLLFVDLNEEIDSKFSWEMDWTYFSLDILAHILLLSFVYFLFKKKRVTASTVI